MTLIVIEDSKGGVRVSQIRYLELIVLEGSG